MRAGDRDVACTLFFFSCFYSPFHVDLGKSLGCYRKSIDCNWKRFSLILLKSPFIDVERRFSVFERRFNVFERTFNVGERRFYPGIKSNASTVSVLFNGKSRPNPSGNHSPERNEDTVFPVDGLDCFSPFYGIYNLLSHFLRS